MANPPSALSAAARLLRQAFGKSPPRLAISLGSGLAAPDSFQARVAIPFSRLPGFPVPGVKGHSGQVAIGRLGGLEVILLSGRAHFYEGFSMGEVTWPIRVLARAGVSTLLLTNAAGAINPAYRAGDFMFLKDHLNFMGNNPLRAWDGAESPFVDLTAVYDPALRAMLRSAAVRAGVRWHEGIYLAVSGPSYETPAEIRAFRQWGADAVGMSTVPEAIVGRACGLVVGAVSCLTNLAAGRSRVRLSHDDVLRRGAAMQRKFDSLVIHFVNFSGENAEKT